MVYGRQPAITGYATVAQTAFSLVATDNSNDKLLGVSLPVHIAYASTNKTTENCLIRDRTLKSYYPGRTRLMFTWVFGRYVASAVFSVLKRPISGVSPISGVTNFGRVWGRCWKAALGVCSAPKLFGGCWQRRWTQNVRCAESNAHSVDGNKFWPSFSGGRVPESETWSVQRACRHATKISARTGPRGK